MAMDEWAFWIAESFVVVGVVLSLATDYRQASYACQVTGLLVAGFGILLTDLHLRSIVAASGCFALALAVIAYAAWAERVERKKEEARGKLS